MSRRGRRYLNAGAAVLVCFVIFMIMVMTVDVQPIGPNASRVGFAGINGRVFLTLGTSAFWEKITELLGLAAIGICACFGLAGLVQLIRYKRLNLVDARILLLGIFYVTVIALYVIFKYVPVNYRPILTEGELETSFPSSHTMLVCCVMISAVPMFNRFIKQSYVCFAADTLMVLLTGVMTVGRLLAGVHWLTDIVGGVILSAGLLLIYNGLLTAADVIAKRQREIIHRHRHHRTK